MSGANSTNMGDRRARDGEKPLDPAPSRSKTQETPTDRPSHILQLCTGPATVLKTSPEALGETFEVNTIGPVVLFQAIVSLRERSDQAEKGGIFVISSSILASIAAAPSFLAETADSVRKAGVNRIIKRISFAHEKIIALAVR